MANELPHCFPSCSAGHPSPVRLLSAGLHAAPLRLSGSPSPPASCPLPPAPCSPAPTPRPLITASQIRPDKGAGKQQETDTATHRTLGLLLSGRQITRLAFTISPEKLPSRELDLDAATYGQHQFESQNKIIETFLSPSSWRVYTLLGRL